MTQPGSPRATRAWKAGLGHLVRQTVFSLPGRSHWGQPIPPFRLRPPIFGLLGHFKPYVAQCLANLNWSIYDVHFRLLLPGCLSVGQACVGTRTLSPSRLRLPPSRLRLPPLLQHHQPSHQLPTRTRPPQGGGGQEEVQEGALHLHLLRLGPRGVSCY